jgi:hypothetical protein
MDTAIIVALGIGLAIIMVIDYLFERDRYNNG